MTFVKTALFGPAKVPGRTNITSASSEATVDPGTIGIADNSHSERGAAQVSEVPGTAPVDIHALEQAIERSLAATAGHAPQPSNPSVSAVVDAGCSSGVQRLLSDSDLLRFFIAIAGWRGGTRGGGGLKGSHPIVPAGCPSAAGAVRAGAVRARRRRYLSWTVQWQPG